MKLITAIVRPDRLDAVMRAATDAGARGLTATEVRGDRKIWFSGVDSVLRVRTGERGRDAA